MTQVGEGTQVAVIDSDEEEWHWLEVNYSYPDGLPVEGTYICTDSDGIQYSGFLNDQGGLCLNYLPPGSVEVKLIDPVEEAELQDIRDQIKILLDNMVKEKQDETKATEARLAAMKPWEQKAEMDKAMLNGLWNGAVGLVEFVWDGAKTAVEIGQYLSPVEKVNNLLEAGYKSYKSGSLTEEKWLQSLRDNFQQEELKDLANLLGFDPRNVKPELFAEAYEITSFIATDDATLDILTKFAKDYAGAQSSLDWAEFAGGGVFEIVLAGLLIAFTAGAGNIAQAASKIRHATKLRKLGHLYRRLGKLLKRKRLNKNLKVSVDQKKKIDADIPAGAHLSKNRLKEKKVKCFKKNKKGTAKEYDRQLEGQQNGLNDLSAEDYLAGRKAYSGKRKSTAATRAKYEKELIIKYQKDDLSKADAIIKASKEMKTLNALHNPDLIAGGKDKITDFGDASVNQSIGSHWKNENRLAEMDKVAEDAIARGEGKKKMNVKMERCK